MSYLWKAIKRHFFSREYRVIQKGDLYYAQFKDFLIWNDIWSSGSATVDSCKMWINDDIADRKRERDRKKIRRVVHHQYETE